MKVGKKSPGEWKSISAPTRDHTGSDLLLFHPTSGPVFQIRAYEKNPYQLQGVGTKLSQSVDYYASIRPSNHEDELEALRQAEIKKAEMQKKKAAMAAAKKAKE